MRRASPLLARLALPLVAVFFAAATGLADRGLQQLRVDLTEDRRFTLSAATVALLRGLDQPIGLKLFVSSRFTGSNPVYASHAKRVQALLREMERAAGGRIRLQIHDPLPYSAAEDLALAEGLEGLLAGSGERVYFGLAGRNAVDRSRTLPFFNPERAAALEYDLASLVASLARPSEPKIGLISSLPLDGNPLLRQPPQAILQTILQSVPLEETALTPDLLQAGFDAIMVVQPSGLSAPEAYVLDQYLLAGGRALLFIDPYSEQQALTNARKGLPPVPPDFAALDPLLAAWGVTLPAGQVVADRLSARRVAVGSAGRRSLLDYVVWLSIPQTQLSATDPSVEGLGRVNLNTAGSLAARAEAATAFDPLAWSSAEAEVMAVGRMAINPDPSALLADYRPGGLEEVLAARLTGPAATAFPGGPPPAFFEALGADRGAHPNWGHLMQSRVPLDLILIADSDLLFDSTWISTAPGAAAPLAGNGALVVKALEILTGDPDLVSLRGGGIADRPFTVIEDLRREAELASAREAQGLIRRIAEVQSEIEGIEETGAGGGPGTQQQTLRDLRDILQQAEQDLRRVQRDFRGDLDRLLWGVQLVNIAAVPLVLALIGGCVVLLRRRRALAGAARLRG
ncbi:MAG: GldG family protein [Rhodospirillales bacterium]|nr:GldG family protein [Rhodospirillales bacterium]